MSTKRQRKENIDEITRGSKAREKSENDKLSFRCYRAICKWLCVVRHQEGVGDGQKVRVHSCFIYLNYFPPQYYKQQQCSKDISLKKYIFILLRLSNKKQSTYFSFFFSSMTTFKKKKEFQFQIKPSHFGHSLTKCTESIGSIKTGYRHVFRKVQ